MRYLLPLFLLMCGCNDAQWTEPPQGLTASNAAAVGAKIEAPALLTVARWLAYYGLDAVPSEETWRCVASYPNYGSPCAEFIWRFEYKTPGLNLPPNLVSGVRISAPFWVPTEYRESFQVTIAGIDSNGNQGPWCAPITYPDSLIMEAVE